MEDQACSALIGKMLSVSLNAKTGFPAKNRAILFLQLFWVFGLGACRKSVLSIAVGAAGVSTGDASSLTGSETLMLFMA